MQTPLSPFQEHHKQQEPSRRDKLMTQAISSLQELSGAIGGTVEDLQELSGFSNSSPKQNLQYIYGHTYWIGVCSMSWNNLKKLRKSMKMKTFKDHFLKNLLMELYFALGKHLRGH
ncbi:unnamed protein product [Camellia sinensis]